MKTTSSQLFRIGDLARLTGKTSRAIHLYEELGLLHPATRSSGGFRLFDASTVERVRWIDLLHAAGFSLQEMSEVLHAWWGAELGPDAMERLRELFARKLDETRETIARHQRLEHELTEGLAYLETCRSCAAPDAPARVCVHCEQNHGMAHEPALVAGITSSPERRARSGRKGLVQIDGRN